MSTIKRVNLTPEEIDLIVGCLVDKQEKALSLAEQPQFASEALKQQIDLNAALQTKLRKEPCQPADEKRSCSVTPGIYIARDDDGLFLAELTEDGIWLAFGYTLSVPIQPDEIMAGPYTVEQLLKGMEL